MASIIDAHLSQPQQLIPILRLLEPSDPIPLRVAIEQDTGRPIPLTQFLSHVTEVQTEISELSSILDRLAQFHRKEYTSDKDSEEAVGLDEQKNFLQKRITKEIVWLEKDGRRTTEDRDREIKVDKARLLQDRLRKELERYRQVLKQQIEEDQQTIRRHCKIAYPEASPEDIEHMALSENGGIFAMAVSSLLGSMSEHSYCVQMMGGRDNNALDVLQRTKARSEAIHSLQQQFIEVNALFEEVSTLVIAQNKAFVRADEKVETVTQDVDGAVVETSQAIVRIKKRNRWKRWVCLAICVVALIACILGLILGGKIKV
jgi:t-SNARE complex subunit (syntaxin)